MQLRFLVRCDEDDAIDEVVVVAALPMAVVENVNSTMSLDYEDSVRISSVAVEIYLKYTKIISKCAKSGNIREEKSELNHF